MEKFNNPIKGKFTLTNVEGEGRTHIYPSPDNESFIGQGLINLNDHGKKNLRLITKSNTTEYTLCIRFLNESAPNTNINQRAVVEEMKGFQEDYGLWEMEIKDRGISVGLMLSRNENEEEIIVDVEYEFY